MKLYILTEDTAIPGFESEHGLSVYFEKDGKKFLFDTGQTDIFLKNAEKFGITLTDIDYLIFSHGHYDHTGGLQKFKINKKTKIVCHPLCIKPKYDGKRYIGFPKVKLDIKFSEVFLKLSDNVYFLGEIPGERKKSLGEVVDEDERKKDFLLDDTGIAITEGDNLIVIAGCAHSGIANIAKYAFLKFPEKKIIVIGGFHMLNYSADEIRKTGEELKKSNVIKVYPGHCTGKEGLAALLNQFPGEKLSAGKQIDV
jgi:7,8-dihydropterin-6-yl-methyl-4-(beta-D-ribofuranosyl)aminobenzene 5'-phosphate synthase